MIRVSGLFALSLVGWSAGVATAGSVTVPSTDCPSAATYQTHLRATVNSGSIVDNVVCRRTTVTPPFVPVKLTIVKQFAYADACNPNCGTTGPQPQTVTDSNKLTYKYTNGTKKTNTISINGKVKWGAGALTSMIAKAEVEIQAGWQGAWETSELTEVSWERDVKAVAAPCSWQKVFGAGWFCVGKTNTTNVTTKATVFYHYDYWSWFQWLTWYDTLVDQVGGDVTITTNLARSESCTKNYASGGCKDTPPPNPTDDQIRQMCGFKEYP